MAQQIAYVELDMNTGKCCVSACGLKGFDNYLDAKNWLSDAGFSYRSTIPSNGGSHKVCKVYARYSETEEEEVAVEMVESEVEETEAGPVEIEAAEVEEAPAVAAEAPVSIASEGTIKVDGQIYPLSDMSEQELEELYSDLFNAAAEASSRRLRHGWRGGEVMYRQYQSENWNARQAIEQELERRLKEVA